MPKDVHKSVLRNDIVADTTPFPKAVKSAEANILNPTNINAMENSFNPETDISYTLVFLSKNIKDICSENKYPIKNITTDITIVNTIHFFIVDFRKEKSFAP